MVLKLFLRILNMEDLPVENGLRVRNINDYLKEQRKYYEMISELGFSTYFTFERPDSEHFTGSLFSKIFFKRDVPKEKAEMYADAIINGKPVSVPYVLEHTEVLYTNVTSVDGNANPIREALTTPLALMLAKKRVAIATAYDFTICNDTLPNLEGKIYRYKSDMSGMQVISHSIKPFLDEMLRKKKKHVNRLPQARQRFISKIRKFLPSR